MARSKVVKFQLFLLFVLTAVVGYTAFKKPPIPTGNLVQSRLDTGKLYHDELVLGSPSVLTIDAAGSLETLDPNSELLGTMAAYPWILNRDTREVEWILDPNEANPTGTLVEQTDSIELGPGTYDVFFTTYGRTRKSRRRRIVGHRGQWTGDKDRWRMVIHASSADGGAINVDSDVDWDAIAPRSENEVWRTGPVHGRQRVEQVFEVKRQTPLTIYTVGEICDGACDYGFIKELHSDSVVWQMDASNSLPAGGATPNKYFRGEIVLPAGIYQIGYHADYGHDFDRWYHNPPFDPTAWGMTLSTTSDGDQSNILALDPWAQQQPVVAIQEVGDNEDIDRYLEVSQTVRIFVSGLGEMSDSGSRYDFAELANLSNGRLLWSMNWDNSKPAGGHENNRLSEAYLTLNPGSYKLSYTSDGSHSFERFSNGTPRNSTRWGVALFVIDGGENAVTITENQGSSFSQTIDETSRGELVVNETMLGNSVDIERVIAVSAPSVFSITAVGEISRSESYDYGWIEDAFGQEIWRMTRTNTSFAGGVDRNRKFEGRILVDPGVYTLHFTTDSGHSYSDFGDDPPENPEQWGVAIYSSPSELPQ